MQREIVAHDADIVKHPPGLDVRLPQHLDLDPVRLLEALPRPGEIPFLASDLSYPAVYVGDGEEEVVLVVRLVAYRATTSRPMVGHCVDGHALREALQRYLVVVPRVVHDPDVVQDAGDARVVGTELGLVYTQRLLVAFLGEFEVTRSLMMTALDVLFDNVERRRERGGAGTESK